MIEILLKHRQPLVIFLEELKLLRTNKTYNFYLGVSEIIGVVVNQDIYYLVIQLFIYLLL